MFHSCDERFYIYIDEKGDHVFMNENWEPLLHLDYGVNTATPTTTSGILCKRFCNVVFWKRKRISE